MIVQGPSISQSTCVLHLGEVWGAALVGRGGGLSGQALGRDISLPEVVLTGTQTRDSLGQTSYDGSMSSAMTAAKVCYSRAKR
jgi:hypothetical protein